MRRDRLLLAVARAACDGQPTVEHAVKLAGSGRASFYEFFDGFAHALDCVTARVARETERSLEAALENRSAESTELEPFALALITSLQGWPEGSLIALASSDGELSPLGSCLREALARSNSERLAPITLGSDFRLLLAAGAAEAFARRIARALRGGEAIAPESGSQLARALAALLRGA